MFFPVHLNTDVMGLLPLEIFQFFARSAQRGALLEITREQRGSKPGRMHDW